MDQAKPKQDGYNGGGSASNILGRGGAGATDVRLDSEDISARIMVAAGAGNTKTGTSYNICKGGGTNFYANSYGTVGYNYNYSGNSNGVGAGDTYAGAGGGYIGGIMQNENTGYGGCSFISSEFSNRSWGTNTAYTTSSTASIKFVSK